VACIHLSFSHLERTAPSYGDWKAGIEACCWSGEDIKNIFVAVMCAVEGAEDSLLHANLVRNLNTQEQYCHNLVILSKAVDEWTISENKP
jgi:hypothetical protein